MVIVGPFSIFFGIFFVFSGANPGWWILHFFSFIIFSYFRDSGVFWALYQPRQDRNISSQIFMMCVKDLEGVKSLQLPDTVGTMLGTNLEALLSQIKRGAPQKNTTKNKIKKFTRRVNANFSCPFLRHVSGDNLHKNTPKVVRMNFFV